MSDSTKLYEAGVELLRAGLNAIPADRAEKYPKGFKWRGFHQERITEPELQRLYRRKKLDAMCLICGKTSGNLLAMDFDSNGEMFDPWMAKVREQLPGLAERFVIQQTPSGGYHVPVRCESLVGGNEKLAMRQVLTDDDSEIELAGETVKPVYRKSTDDYIATAVLIETRGQGGLILCDPSHGYQVIQGKLTELPTVTVEELNTLLDIARSFDESIPEPVGNGWTSKAEYDEAVESTSKKPQSSNGELTPWHDYNQRGDVEPLLMKHGWNKLTDGAISDWARPGKNEPKRGGTLNADRVFQCYSSNAHPLEHQSQRGNKGYNPFELYVALEHGGDTKAAARQLRSEGFGHQNGTKPTKGSTKEQKPSGETNGSEKHREWLQPITSAEFDAQEYSTVYLVEDILVAQQPCILAGARKSLKTTLLVEMAMSLGGGLPFLGKFATGKTRRVAVFSGESGRATLQEIARRVARTKGMPLKNFDVLWNFSVPKMSDIAAMVALEEFIEKEGAEVVILDPTYLMLNLGEGANNLFAVGEKLWVLTELIEKTGSTLVIAHHTRKNSPNPFEPPELEDIAWSGFQEWARQWVLLGRRERYNPDNAGDHKLWLTYGGSAGHSGLWGLDAVEGVRSDPGGRRWDIELLRPSEVRSEAIGAAERLREERQREKRLREIESDSKIVLNALRAIGDAGETVTQLSTKIKISCGRTTAAIEHLNANGFVEECDVLRSNKQSYPGYRTVSPRHPDTPRQHPDKSGC